jgi:hypothetical protein
VSERFIFTRGSIIRLPGLIVAPLGCAGGRVDLSDTSTPLDCQTG